MNKVAAAVYYTIIAMVSLHFAVSAAEPTLASRRITMVKSLCDKGVKYGKDRIYDRSTDCILKAIGVTDARTGEEIASRAAFRHFNAYSSFIDEQSIEAWLKATDSSQRLRVFRVKGHLMVPLRYVASRLKDEFIEINPETRGVVVRQYGEEVLVVRNGTPVVNSAFGVNVLPVSPHTVDGVFYVPARLFKLAFGIDFVWDVGLELLTLVAADDSVRLPVMPDGYYLSERQLDMWNPGAVFYPEIHGTSGPIENIFKGIDLLAETKGDKGFVGHVPDSQPSKELAPIVTGKIIFDSYRDGNYGVYSMNADGTCQTRLTKNVGSARSPSQSPDGSKIAYCQSYSSRAENSEIYVMKADGTGKKRLTFQTGYDGNPSWSPDGRKIAFVSRRDGNDEIYVMNTDGSGQIRLTSDRNADFNPSWSPDGKKIAFCSYRDGDAQVYIMRADGTGREKLTTGTGGNCAPSWSPDGKKLAFVSKRDGNDEIYVMDADGLQQTRLTINIGWNRSPSWSPDGSRIVYQSYCDGDNEICIMNADGSGQKLLTSNTEYDGSPSWAPL